ncbi:MAG: hypothetical protein KDB22_21150 [Planctomycetales bacterium]|nr:hypothetical protein [Planctomycetales bacterium]
MTTNTRIIAAAIFFLLVQMPSAVRADLVLNFEGQFFTDFVGQPTFSPADRISGTFVFDDIGTITIPTVVTARSIRLGTSVNGGDGLLFNITDAATDARVTLNQFEFSPGSLIPTTFIVTVAGEVFGDASFPEQLSIADIGDLATIDFGSTGSEANALNLAPGSLTAIPEPTCLSTMAMALIGVLLPRRRQQ